MEPDHNPELDRLDDFVDVGADDQLRLMFLCAHPALAADAQVGLILRLLAGLSTAEIATAFVVPEATMAQRIVRAKRKLQDNHAPTVYLALRNSRTGCALSSRRSTSSSPKVTPLPQGRRSREPTCRAKLSGSGGPSSS